MAKKEIKKEAKKKPEAKTKNLLDAVKQRTTREAKYEFWKSEKDDLWYFHLRAANGEVQTPSEGYSTKQKCLGGILAAQKNSATAAIVQTPPKKK